ncbi:MAG: hypothetical protein M3O31_18350 [Acidobacteriota bacterium]|nr:hypothetical protein [Acidobacteriota bacterium]
MKEVEDEFAADDGEKQRDGNPPGKRQQRAGVRGPEPGAVADGSHLGEVTEDRGGTVRTGDAGEKPFCW